MQEQNKQMKNLLSDSKNEDRDLNGDNPYQKFNDYQSEYQNQGVDQNYHLQNQFNNQFSPNKSQQLSCVDSFQSDIRQYQRNQSQQVNQKQKQQKKESKHKKNKKQQKKQQQSNFQQSKKQSKRGKQSSYTCRNINYMVNYFPKKYSQLIRIQIQQIQQTDHNGKHLEQFVIISNRYPDIKQVVLGKQQLPIFYNTLVQTYHKVSQLQPRYAPRQSYNPSIKLIILYIFKNLFSYFKKYLKTFCKDRGVWNGQQMSSLSSLQLFFNGKSRKKKQKYDHQPLHIGGMYYLCCRFFRKLLIVLLQHKEQFKLSSRYRNEQDRRTKNINIDHNFQRNLEQFVKRRIKQFRKQQQQQLQNVKRQIKGPIYFKVINCFIRHCQQEDQMQKFDPKLSSIHHQIQKIRYRFGYGSKIGRSTILRNPNVNRRLDFKIAQIFIKGKLKNFKTVSLSDKELKYNEQQLTILKEIKSSIEQQKFRQLIKKASIQKSDNPKDRLLLIQFNDEKQTKMSILPTGRFIIGTKSRQEVNRKIRLLLIQVLRGRFSINQQQVGNDQCEQDRYYDSSKSVIKFIIDCQLGYELDFNRLTQVIGIREGLTYLEGKQYLSYNHQTNAGTLVQVYLYKNGYIKFLYLKSQQQAKEVCDYIQNLYLNHQDMIDEYSQQSSPSLSFISQSNQNNQGKEKNPQKNDKIQKKKQQIKQLWVNYKRKQYSEQQLIKNQYQYLRSLRQPNSDDQLFQMDNQSF